LSLSAARTTPGGFFADETIHGGVAVAPRFWSAGDPARESPDFPLAEGVALPRVGASMIAPETFSHIENIKKRAGYLWRFL
jgi:hypothetical protein